MARRNPRFAITVVTTRFPTRRPASWSAIAHAARTWSPFTTRPRASENIARSASPSWATPASDAGVAHDGDADRAMFSDARGRVVNGDQVLAACAIALHEAGRLVGNRVVTTVMANLGFRRAMDEAGIDVLTTSVGDRYVLEEMLRSGAVVGGEQSGHLIFREHATTGDGLLTAIKFLSLAAATGATVDELAWRMRRYPQVLENVEVADRDGLEEATDVWTAVKEAERELG